MYSLKIALGAKDDKRIQSYAYETSKDIIHKNEKIKHSNVIKQCEK